MTYPYPENITKFSDLMVWSNSVVDGWFGIGTLLLLFAVVFISTIQFGAKKAFAISSWVSFLLGIMYFAIGVITGREMVFLIAMIGLSVVWLFMSKE